MPAPHYSVGLYLETDDEGKPLAALSARLQTQHNAQPLAAKVAVSHTFPRFCGLAFGIREPVELVSIADFSDPFPYNRHLIEGSLQSPSVGRVLTSVETIEPELVGMFVPEIGLHYNHHRYYHPHTARYLTPDPLGLTPAPNPYPANPTTFIDLHGLNPCPARQFKEWIERDNHIRNTQVCRGLHPLTEQNIYAGMTKDLEGQLLQHNSPQERFGALDPVAPGEMLSRNEARAVEEALIMRAGRTHSHPSPNYPHPGISERPSQDRNVSADPQSGGGVG